MNSKLTKLLLTVLTLLTAATVYGQKTTPTGIIVNGEVLTKKMKSLQLYKSDNYSNFGFPVETVAITFEDSDGKEVVEKYYPSTIEVWFGDPTSIRDLYLYDAGEQQGEMTLEGLEPGSTIRVYDASGCLRHTTKADGRTSIDLSSLPKGIYIVRSGKVAIKVMNK